MSVQNMESVYDRALVEVGQNGRFQKQFDIIYNMIFMALWSMSYMSIILALVVIPHHCKLPGKPENFTEYEWKLKHIPRHADVSGKIKFSSCLIYVNKSENNNTKECHEYDYDKTWYESTVPSEQNWVCDKELFVANVYAYTRIGEIVGSIIFGWFGDGYGRRLTYIVSLVLLVIGRILSILMDQFYILFVIGCIIACLPSWSAVQSTMIISLEISSPERRTIMATMRFASWSFGVCVMSLLYWWLRSWKLFLIVTTAIQLPYVLLSWKMIESPRWLWIEGKTKLCVKQLKRIAKTNKTKLEKDTEKQFFTTPSPGKSQVMGVWSLFSGWNLAVTTLLQLSLWISATLSYTVLLMSSGEKTDGNPFLEFAWQSAAEIPGHFLGGWLADHIGRRYTGITSYSITASMWALIAIRESSADSWINSWWIGISLPTISRLWITVSYYTINLLNMELYPTCLRQSGMSLGNVLSSGSSAVAPYVMYIGRRIDNRLPSVILTGVSMVGVISSYLLPETLHAKLPETIEDAHVFKGNDKKYLSIFSNKTSSQRETENL